jgi:NitT/TauT family transport system substrate-binding protein
MKTSKYEAIPMSIHRLIFLTLILLAFPSCRDSKNTSKKGEYPKSKVIINTWPGLSPFYLAKSKGFDLAEGVQLEIEMSENVDARRSSLLSGEADLVGITLDTIVIANSKSIPMTIIAESDIFFGGDGIIASKEIQSVSGLRGKRIACAEGQPSHFFLLHLLKNEGMGSDDFKLIPADDGSQAATLFAAGQVDAAVTWDPWISQAEKLTQGHVLITTKEAPGLLLGILAANRDLLPERVDRISRVMRAWFRAVEYCRTNREEAYALMAGNYNVSVEEFARMIAGAQLADLEENKKILGTKTSPGPAFQLAIDASDLWQAAGAIDNPVDPKSVFDWSVLEQLTARRN